MVVTLDEERRRMAMYLGLDPGGQDKWPIGIIDQLLAGEKNYGWEWLHRELRAMLVR